MYLFYPGSTRRRLLAGALAISAAGAVVLSSDGPHNGGALGPQGFPTASAGAAAATIDASLPARPVDRRKRGASPLAISGDRADHHALMLYFLMEAARPMPMFAR